MKILVTKKGVVECYEDSYEEGELDYASSWDFDVRGEYDSAEDLIKAIVKATYLFDFKIDEFVFTDGAIQTSDLVDEESIKADKHDIELWKKGEKTLYSAIAVRNSLHRSGPEADSQLSGSIIESCA